MRFVAKLTATDTKLQTAYGTRLATRNKSRSAAERQDRDTGKGVELSNSKARVDVEVTARKTKRKISDVPNDRTSGSSKRVKTGTSVPAADDIANLLEDEDLISTLRKHGFTRGEQFRRMSTWDADNIRVTLRNSGLDVFQVGDCMQLIRSKSVPLGY